MGQGPKFPEVEVKLIGEDGNAFSILGRCRAQVALARRNSLSAPNGVEWDEFYNEATSGDYDHLLSTVMKWFATF